VTPEQIAAWERVLAAGTELIRSYKVPLVTDDAKPPVPARVPARQGAHPAPQLTLPRPATAPPKAGTVLTDKIRKDNLPAAKAIALKILKVVGDNPNLTQGVQGQLAIERIPYDGTLVQQAIDAARREL
jgi:hypothetical protein